MVSRSPQLVRRDRHLCAAIARTRGDGFYTGQSDNVRQADAAVPDGHKAVNAGPPRSMVSRVAGATGEQHVVWPGERTRCSLCDRILPGYRLATPQDSARIVTIRSQTHRVR